ncbi:hypothetical protein WJU23_04130 [Prosthecobacter sp. SYSU 5D2]|uniref:hypothetical protein n=1 Tax=Prosthecobacter sp. SYSU 5D2 TaxID=3134134 RepID=UPI0031FF325B
MLRLPDTDLEKEHSDSLQNWQGLVDAKASFGEQVEEAKKQCKTKNDVNNPTFRAVRSGLVQMHGDLIRCAHCEYSRTNEVEHIYPKTIYPNRVFNWLNYTYACRTCNGPKDHKFASFLTSGQELDVTPSKR